MLASLLYLLWPNGSSGSGRSGDAKHEASAPRISPAKQGATAAQTLSALPAVNLSMVYAPVEHQSITRATLTVTSTGQASGTLSEPVAGKSSLAWSGDQLYLKGDSAFWAQQDPQFGHDLTSTGHWVAPEKRSGYYMLDSFAVNAGSLTPASLATLVRQVTSDPEAVREDGATFQGRKAVSYTSGGWTVVLAAESPYPVLAIGGDPGHDDPVKSAVWHPAQRTGPVMKPADHRTNAVPADDSDYSSYLLLEPKPATTEQAAAVRTTTATAVATAVPPATSTEAVSKTMGPAFTITSDDPYLCTTNPCSYSITVTNSGDQAGDATLYLNMPQVPTGPHPLGNLKPKQSKTVSGTRPNIAPPGKTVTFTDYAWVYSTAEYGPDPKVGSRLNARNLRPGDLSFGTPLRPTVAGLLDAMTRDRPTSDTEAGSKATDAIEAANEQGELPDLGAIVGSGRLDNPQDLREILPTTDKTKNRRVLQQIALMLRTDPHAHVTWTAPSTAAGATPPADYLYTTTEQGRQVKRAVKAETVRSPAELGSQARLGAAQLNGEQPDSGTAGGQKARSGYERVLRLDLEPFVGPLLELATTQDLEHSLSTGQQFQPLRDGLCEANGSPRVDRLVIVNASGTHQWTDLHGLGVRCAGTGEAPASPGPSGSSRPDGKPTCPPQRLVNGGAGASGAGWFHGISTEAVVASSCPDPTWGGRVKFLRDEQGRLHEMNAVLTRDMLDKGTEANQRLRPPGFSGGDHNQARGHLLAKRLGGSGDTLDNLFTITQNPTNSPKMRDDEGEIYDAVAAGEKVIYNVYLEYANRSAKIPKYIQLEAVGDRRFHLDVVLKNPAYKQE
ncbi:DNA/RNA non-specific endonuclease [Streptomyces sp. NPDC048106]|uniref:DNA/RNA non-specific endonuclease n=1 Tax=Streptomyces sp. NPDC048106 TaxID=3155750 RepID=UPI0034538F9B